MTDETAASPAAGWYADPLDSARVRWWDGTAWSEHTRAAPTPEPVGVASAPVRTVEPVSAASTPVSTPEPAAERETATSWIMNPTPSRAGDFAPMEYAQARTMDIPGRWHTNGAWALAFLPWIGVVMGVVILLLAVIGTRSWVWFAAPFLPLLLLLVFAMRDRARLAEYGYERRASLAWILLGPLAYLVVRTVRVHQQSGRGSAVLWVYVINTLLVAGIGVGAQLWITAENTHRRVAAIEQSIEAGLGEQGQAYTVDCPTSGIILPVGTKFTCTAVADDGSGGLVEVTILSGGRFSYALSTGVSGSLASGS